MSFGKRKIVTEAAQTFSFQRRTFVLGGLQGAIGVALAARLGYLSVIDTDHYKKLSESNRLNMTLIPPRRGWIVDRTGKPLANNRVDFRVDLIPERVVDIDRTLVELARLLKLDRDEVDRIRDDIKKAAGFQPVQVADALDYERYAAVSVRLPDLPGVSPARGFSRNYPSGAAIGHLIGYVGSATAEDYEETHNPLYVTPGFKVGKQGLEKSFNEALTGKPGAKRVEVTAHGRIVRELTTRPDDPGKTLRLTIDADLQEYAARRIGPESGSVVVMDCETGDILTLASMPSFDPNSFSDGISHVEWEMMQKDNHVPLRNKTLQGLYPPGSTVKPMIATSFLEAGLSPTATTVCNGAIRVGDTLFHCWQPRGHGHVDMAKGIYQSCDVYFYHFAQQIGMDAIASMARRFGLGQEFKLPFPSQSYGTVPDPEWKLRKYGKKWQTYDTVNATIGQGYFLVNPTQLAVMVSRIASGRQVVPRFLQERTYKPAPLMDIAPEHLQIIRQAMKDVVNGPGTAGRARPPIPNVLIGGKTGTAQVRHISMAERRTGVISNAALPWKYRDHGLFICFAPYDKPKYAVAVVIEHGGGSGSAYPIARDVMTFIYDRQKAWNALEPLEKAWGGDIGQRMQAELAAFKAKRDLEEAIKAGRVPLPNLENAIRGTDE